MLIIPELKTVVIQPPRTGSTGLRDAVQARYPKAISLYRHMERPGIPAGYEHWKTCCLVREPFDRLASIYNYMRDFRPTSKPGGGAKPGWIARLKQDTDRSFEAWLLNSTEVFTEPRDIGGEFLPYYNITERMPIARKSLYHWARPDLGAVQLLRIGDPSQLVANLGVEVDVVNRAAIQDRPVPTDRVRAHLNAWFSWDQTIMREMADAA